MSCNNQPKQVDNITSAKTDKTPNNISVIISNDTLQSEGQQEATNILYSEQQSNNTDSELNKFKDSVIYFDGNLYKDLDSELKEISNNKFKDYKKTYKTTCELDKNGFVSGKGLILDRYCKDICETYLIDKKKKNKLVLPADYDQGIIGLIISPSCNQFIVYSSYDGPDYSSYYEDRAEVFGFTISQGQGLKIIKPSFKFYTKDWSIEEVIWISENEIAFKTYEENRNAGNQDNLKYKYFKTSLNK